VQFRAKAVLRVNLRLLKRRFVC